MFILDQLEYFKNYCRGKNKTQSLAGTVRAAKSDHLSVLFLKMICWRVTEAG